MCLITVARFNIIILKFVILNLFAHLLARISLTGLKIIAPHTATILTYYLSILEYLDIRESRVQRFHRLQQFI